MQAAAGALEARLSSTMLGAIVCRKCHILLCFSMRLGPINTHLLQGSYCTLMYKDNKPMQVA